jgi:hypothetical protein
MSPNVLRFPARSARSLLCIAAVAGVTLPAWRVRAQYAPIADAPMVPPAAMVDRPLAPAANDTPGEQPSPQHIWVPGHWRWSEGSYVWETGRWEVPPTPSVQWIAPQWQQQANGYTLREGYWQEADATQPVAQASAPAPQIIETTTPPPPPQREIIYERPSAMDVWVSGYWAWRGGRHVWVSGHWDRPPRTNLVWAPARWEYRDGRYIFINGYWRDAVTVVATAPTQQVVVAPATQVPTQQVVVVAPPPPRAEVVYARPSPYHVWVAGYWAWERGRHVWIAGHWTLPPRGFSRWQEPRWEHRGGNYVFIEGHWGR